MQSNEGTRNRGPASIPGVLDREPPPARTAAEVSPEALRQTEDTFVFLQKPVDIGDGRPVEALTFVKLKREKLVRVQEVARRNRVGMVTCPDGWKPGR